MSIQFEKLKKYFPTDQPIPVKQGRVRGNKTIFKVGPTAYYRGAPSDSSGKYTNIDKTLDLLFTKLVMYHTCE